MSKNMETYLTSLREAGYRITEQRQAICEYLAQTEKHPTPYEVYADLTAVYPDISRATVYNTLKTLQQLGAIVEINFGANHTHYETDTSPHVNLICLQCHAVVDYHGDFIPTEEFTRLQESLAFQPLAAKLDVLGLCQKCQQQKS
ncbi:MAG: Fur family transcriptional regulator [Caldilineaceae bacterium]